MSDLPPFPRLKFIDFDARREPKTSRSCIMCQKDLKARSPAHPVRVIEIGGGPYSVHPADEAAFDAQGAKLDTDEDYRDLGTCLMGPDCARAHGSEWMKG